jgi:hypothetical protein
MASTDISVISYDDGSRRESLLSILRDVSPNTDNYFVSNLKKAPNATNTLHEWVTYNTARATADGFVAEGAAPSYAVINQPVRTSNITAIQTAPVRVTGTERAIATATGEDPFVFSKAEALKSLKSKMEYSIVNGTRASGASGTARGMTGIIGCISTNFTARGSGTSFTETEFNDIMQDSYDAVGSAYIADLLVCPMVIKRRIATFTTNTRNIEAKEKRLTSEVQVYDSSVGKSVMIIPHKDLPKAAGTVTVLALNESTFAMSFLTGREPQWQELAVDGDRSNGQYLAEFTVVSYADRANVKRTGYFHLLS